MAGPVAVASPHAAAPVPPSPSVTGSPAGYAGLSILAQRERENQMLREQARALWQLLDAKEAQAAREHQALVARIQEGEHIALRVAALTEELARLEQAEATGSFQGSPCTPAGSRPVLSLQQIIPGPAMGTYAGQQQLIDSFNQATMSATATDEQAYLVAPADSPVGVWDMLLPPSTPSQKPPSCAPPSHPAPVGLSAEHASEPPARDALACDDKARPGGDVSEGGIGALPQASHETLPDGVPAPPSQPPPLPSLTGGAVDLD
eukprot:gnl/TRDRNA2_/TRDRNA2_194140_c0_seq1.p1 gnl/TRDRNA2_/TRDRNA2_194140_c0~~gnl/TRDRNA2_/TRDRNA2_194140_c0_seq1.p1  ORF type:complete len:288 (-),score=38.15 gnl/TRDRNA2_/TRDRNA2_194140_c0_seq1:145-933(-)